MKEDISYQNKDILSKIFADMFGEKSLNVYGLDLPKIRRLLPTNLPAIAADELRMDNFAEFVDDSRGIVDYMSSFKEEDMVRFGQYLLRVSARFVEDKQPIPILRMIVIFTADVQRKDVPTEFDRGGYCIRIHPAFLSELDSEEIRERLNRKVRNGERLTDEELMEFIILPLSYRTKEKKQEMLKEQVTLAKRIEDRKTLAFLLSGLLVFSDKIIDPHTRDEIGRMVHMTQFEQMWWEQAERKYEPLLAAKDEELAAKDKELAAKDREKAKELAAKDREKAEELAAKDREKAEELAAKDKEKAEELAAKDKEKAKELAAKDKEKASQMLSMVNNLIRSSSMSLEDACRVLGLTMEKYFDASAILMGN